MRSRFVSVRGGKVVPFCSAECREAPASAPKPEPPPAAKVESKPEP